MRSRTLHVLAISCAVAALVVPTTSVRADDPTIISAAQLEKTAADPNSWLTYGRDLGATRYSPLDQIGLTSVSGLTPAWTKKLGPPVSMEATPIVSNGVMYVTTGKSALYALDAKTGKSLWSFVYPLPASAFAHTCCNYDNRGVTLSGRNVILATLDAHLIALDAKSGKIVWNTVVAKNTDGYAITSPPLPVKNMLITGVGGGEFPTRGFIAAYDATSGKQLWKRYTIPGPGEPGYETWKISGTAARGGGPTWLPGTYDPQRNTIYWGTGNPNPDWDTNGTKGDLLYTSSILALDADSGKITWHYQITPHNIWDYDAVSEPIIADVPINGTTVPVVAHADRNGYLYLLNRDTGKLVYAVPFLDKITWGTVDRTTGTIAFNPAIQAAARARKPYTVSPSVIGGKNWEPAAYDPRTHLYFIPALESSQTITPATTTDMHPKKGAMNFGGSPGVGTFPGSISAWDLSTGKMVWKHHFRSPAFGGALVTGGGLVFVGQMEGQLDAFDEHTGKLMWSAKTPSGITAPPMTYAIDGTQYVSVSVGTGGVFPIFFLALTPWLKNVPPASMVYTYKLPAKTASR